MHNRRMSTQCYKKNTSAIIFLKIVGFVGKACGSERSGRFPDYDWDDRPLKEAQAQIHRQH